MNEILSALTFSARFYLHQKGGSRQINLQTAARKYKTFYCVFNAALEGPINCYDDGHMLVRASDTFGRRFPDQLMKSAYRSRPSPGAVL